MENRIDLICFPPLKKKAPGHQLRRRKEIFSQGHVYFISAKSIFASAPALTLTSLVAVPA